MSRANWPGYIADRSAYLKGVMVDEYEKTPQAYQQIYDVQPLDGYEVTYKEVIPPGLLNKLEGEEPENWRELSYKPGPSVTIRYGWYGASMTFTKPFLMDQVDSLGEERARGLMASAMATEEYYAALFFNNIRTASGDYLLYDGKALAATDHSITENVLGGSTTVSNFLNADFSHSAMAAAVMMMKAQTNEIGLPTIDFPTRCVMAAGLEAEWTEVMGSQLRSDTAENAVNVFQKGMGDVTPIWWRYLDSATHWTLLGRNPKGMFMRRQGIQLESERSFRKKSLAFTVETMFGIKWRTWRSVLHGTN